MSYSLKLVVKNGEAQVDPQGTTSGLLPDGIFMINGHVPHEGTWQAESLNITRFVEDENFNSPVQVMQASATCNNVKTVPVPKSEPEVTAEQAADDEAAQAATEDTTE